MKHALTFLWSALVILILLWAGIMSNRAEERHDSITKQVKVPEITQEDRDLLIEIIEHESEIQNIGLMEHESEIQKFVGSDIPLLRNTEFVNLTFEEQDLLERIAMAEARGEGSVGMALVMRVVLNRSLKTGQSIHDVIYAPNQFYTAGMTAGNDECHEALAMVMDGWDESNGAIYFCAGGYSAYGEPLMQVGNHYFSK